MKRQFGNENMSSMQKAQRALISIARGSALGTKVITRQARHAQRLIKDVMRFGAQLQIN